MSNGNGRSGWAAAGIGFAAAILLMVGSFQVISGLAAILNDNFFSKPPHYT